MSYIKYDLSNKENVYFNHMGTSRVYPSFLAWGGGSAIGSSPPHKPDQKKVLEDGGICFLINF